MLAGGRRGDLVLRAAERGGPHRQRRCCARAGSGLSGQRLGEGASSAPSAQEADPAVLSSEAQKTRMSLPSTKTLREPAYTTIGTG